MPAASARGTSPGSSSGRRGPVDTGAVTGEADERCGGSEPERGSDGATGASPSRLHAVSGPAAAADPAPAPRLWREWKGLTVADLLRTEIAERLPGQVRSALHHLQRGDLRAAEAALPGEFAKVLPGPGRRRAARARRLGALAAAVAAAAALAAWWWP